MSWDEINLAKIERRPAVQPTLGGVGFVYPGRRHVFSGPPESAKTLVAYAILLAEARRGNVGVLIDFEMGRHEAFDRLHDLGATDDDFGRITYLEPDTPLTEETVGRLIDLNPTLVVIDSVAGAFRVAGLDDTKRADVEHWAARWIQPFWFCEIATIVLDHVVKSSENRGQWAIGSERKIAGTDVHLGFEPRVPLRRGGKGVYVIHTHKDRFGHIRRPHATELRLQSDPETHAISWTTASANPAEATNDHFRPTCLMERVSRFLEAQAAPVSRNTIEKSVSGKASGIRHAIDCLIAEGYACAADGSGRRRPVSSLRPFREGQVVPSAHEAQSTHRVPDIVPCIPRNHAARALRPLSVPNASLQSIPPSSQSVPSSTEEDGGPGRGEVTQIEETADLGELPARDAPAGDYDEREIERLARAARHAQACS